MKKYEYIVTKAHSNSNPDGYNSINEFTADANRFGAQGFRFVCKITTGTGWGGGGWLFERETEVVDTTNKEELMKHNLEKITTDLSMI